MPKILLVLPTSTYRATDFLDAARVLGAEVIVASEEAQALATTMGNRALEVDLCDPLVAAAAIAAAELKPDAVVGVDEQGVLVAALAAELLGLAHNPPDAVAITRDKARLRKTLTAAGLAQPRVGQGLGSHVGFPCVVKATSLSGSRGVIRADDDNALAAALVRTQAIAGEGAEVIVESYVPGAEVAVEGLLTQGVLTVLAIFDKPDPLEGPYFEETIYVTPSRHEKETQDAIERTVAAACAAIGLVEGPIHAELRLPDGAPDSGPVLLEVAARSIGGLCSRALTFGAGISLEEVILRHAIGRPLGDVKRESTASGVMMIPIPRDGVLRSVGDVDVARAVEGVNGIEITIPKGQHVRMLPEGDRYLGFLFATGPAPEDVEAALRRAHGELIIDIG